MMRVVKCKISKIAIIAMLLLSFTTFLSNHASANETSLTGFIVKADLIEGNTMVSKITLNNQGQPVIRFEYKEAKIHGMTLVKEFNTPSGPVSTIIKATGPIKAQNLIVDATGIDFQGACVAFGVSYPEVGLKNVTLVSEYMTSSYMDMKNLSLTTVNGHSSIKKPHLASVLTDLHKKGANIIKDEIQNIMDEKRPLSCDTGAEDGGETTAPTNPVGEVLDPVLDVTDPLIPDEITDPIKEVLDPILDGPGKVLDPVLEVPGKVLDPVLDIPGKIIDPVLEAPGKIIEPIKELPPKIVEPIKDIPIEPLDPIVDPLLDEALVLIDDTITVLEELLATLSKTKDTSLKEKVQKNITELQKLKDELITKETVSKEQLDRLKIVNKQAEDLTKLLTSILSKTLLPIHLLTTTLLSLLLEPLDILTKEILKL
ncbi:DUF6230 family protein [Fredinandcohnia sp. 179-A 10B2 NHS]|uniref:DUF6230 family protein n=1 Tax=Fredinandcohnia sp. 179-A 10B2 NHS TaxID=3235176 RepID=UPI0039A0F544